MRILSQDKSIFFVTISDVSICSNKEIIKSACSISAIEIPASEYYITINGKRAARYTTKERVNEVFQAIEEFSSQTGTLYLPEE